MYRRIDQSELQMKWQNLSEISWLILYQTITTFDNHV